MRPRSLALGWVIFSLIAASAFTNAAPSALNPGTVTIADPSVFSAIYAVSDVHGMFGALQKLLRENGLTDANGHWSGGKALLLIEGDSIDKGPQSVEVLDQWIQLESEADAVGGRVLPMLGNHEAEFLSDPTSSNSKAQALLSELQQRGIPVEQLADARFPRGRFLRGLPLAVRVGNWLFCHAGFMPDQSWNDLTSQAAKILGGGDYSDPFLIGDDSILEAKKWWRPGTDARARLESRLDRAGLAGVVFGHQPKALNIVGAIAISEDHRLIKIDNGMAPEAGSHPGSLLLFPSPAELSGPTGHKLEAFALVAGKRKALTSESRLSLGD